MNVSVHVNACFSAHDIVVHGRSCAYIHVSLVPTSKVSICKERYKEGLLWAGRGTIPVNELA